MRTKIQLSFFMCIALYSVRGQYDTLRILYYENSPYAYTEKTAEFPEKGQVRGIEMEIMEEYVSWLKQRKGISPKLSYWLFTDFGAFYKAVKTGRSNTVGLGSVTRTSDREKEVHFSSPYLLNQAVLITHGSIPAMRDKSPAEISKTLGGLRALVVAGTSHETYLKSLKADYVPDLKITYVSNPKAILDSLATNKSVFGYCDIVTYWNYIKTNPNKYLKIQKVVSPQKEELGFILPKTNLHGFFLAEFFESGFGFTATKSYRQILERYLGYEIIDYVEVD